ncbi:MAG: hypothetical protein ABH823_04840 [bacterium]
MTIKKAKQTKCECGRLVAEGSVFCLLCRATVKRRNAKILVKEQELFATFVKKN